MTLHAIKAAVRDTQTTFHWDRRRALETIANVLKAPQGSDLAGTAWYLVTAYESKR